MMVKRRQGRNPSIHRITIVLSTLGTGKELCRTTMIMSTNYFHNLFNMRHL